MLQNRRLRHSAGHQFSQSPQVGIPRSYFKRSHTHKTAFDSGFLIPIYADEALPGDTFNVKLHSMARLATPIVPFMDNLYIDFFFFAVPNRLLWNNWQKFMGEQTDPGDSISFTCPTVQCGTTVGSLFDHLGIPTVYNYSVNVFHSRAYNLIYNEWFRSEDLQDSVVVDLDDGPDTTGDYVLLRRGKRHDYFTSCLPAPQKGAGISLPLGTTAPVVGTGQALGLLDGTGKYGLSSNATGGLDGSVNQENASYGDAATGGTFVADKIVGVSDLAVDSGLVADLTNATAATINSLREAFQLQRMLERDARGGTRYREILQAHFKVTSPDARLQRPEYLGGGTSSINITPIAQTVEQVGGGTPQGYLAAIGYHQQSGIGFTKSFVEHSVILGMCCVRADLTYQQGINRMWHRQTKHDFYWPALAHLGEQEVLNKEIWLDNTANDDLVFGYQERWAEYRYFPNMISGILRSDAASSLDVWHLSQDFSVRPALNAAFIEENPPVARVVAVPSEPEIIFDSFFEIICTRPMPLYSIPGLIDHM